MIRRRLLVNDSTFLVELHEIIQISMGWEDYHLWTFSINGREYGHAYGEGLTREDYDTTLSDLDLLRSKDFSTITISATFGSTRCGWDRSWSRSPVRAIRGPTGYKITR